jgi:kumamolisin
LHPPLAARLDFSSALPYDRALMHRTRVERPIRSIVLLMLAVAATPGFAAPARSRSTSPRLRDGADLGPAPASDRHAVVVALGLRNREELDAFLADVQNPASPQYHRFLTQDEFNARFGPTPEDEAAVIAHLERGGLRVTQRFANRLLVRAAGNVAALERTFGVRIHAVGLGGARHFAALDEPDLPAEIAGAVVGVIGLDDLTAKRPHVHALPAAAPHAALGSSCCSLSPNDLFALYDESASFPGSGQTIVIAGAYAWSDPDNAVFDAQWGLPQLPAGSGQVCTGGAGSGGCRFSRSQSIEIALDVQYAHGTAPGARILNYMSASTSNADFTTMYNRIVTDNPGHVVSTSWGSCEALTSTGAQQADDAIFANANAIGQSWFAASGDDGSRDCGTSTVTVDNPANSPHVMGVGGTTPTCSAGLQLGNPACGGYGSETGWDGSGGGASQVFARPGYQTGCGVPAGTKRLVPDVALEADPTPGNYVVEGGSWWIVGGTSDAAPQWAGMVAGLAQKKGGALGNPGAFLYGLCGTSAFHDVTTGSNGDFAAGPGYDMVTGLGSFDAQHLLAAVGASTTTTTSTSSTNPPTTSSSHAPTTTTQAPTTTTSTSSTNPPTTSSTHAPTTTTQAPTTSTTAAPVTTTSSTRPPTTTTTIPACLPLGAACTTSASCCSNACKVHAGQKQCR